MEISRLFREFTQNEKASGVILIIVSSLSILVANSSLSESYLNFWHLSFAGKPLEFWINDGLMTLFFLMVGLEIEREFYKGELSDLRRATLPLVAALGGMLLPASIHFAFNYGSATQNGFAIPMATDIAFSLAVMALLGDRVPFSLKVFLTALAIIDDLGAILIIAFFYSEGFSVLYFSAFLALFALMLLLNRLKVYLTLFYIIPGIAMWFCLFKTGIHPTITGVLLAFALPFGKGDSTSISYRWQQKLHFPVAFLVLPLFAMANTAIRIDSNAFDQLITSNGYGIIFGLLLGKPAGIFIFSMLGAALGLCTLPPAIKKIHLLGAGCLAGIGFTMSIFITLLAFNNAEVTTGSKIAIITASVLSAVMGLIILTFSLRKKTSGEEVE